MIYGPYFKDVLKLGERLLHFAQVLVDRDHFHDREL